MFINMILIRNPMKRQMLILAILIASFILLSSCTNQLSDENILKDPESAMKACEGLSPNDKIGCYMHISQLQANNSDIALQACSLMPDNNAKLGCIGEVVKAQSDSDKKIEICKKADDQSWIKGCIENTAVAEKDQKKAITLCNAIADDTNFREHCLNSVLGNSANVSTEVKLSACDSRTGMNRDYCYQEIGTGLFEADPEKGVEVCNKITDKNIKNNCLNYFMSSPELIKKYPVLAIQICDSLTLKDNCYMNVADKLSATDPERAAEVCQKLSDEIQVSNCFGNVWFSFDSRVRENYDFSIKLCNSLDLKRNDCFRRVAGAFMSVDKAKAEATCKMISDTSSNGCLAEIR